MEQSLEKYSKMPVSQAVIKNALPAVTAMLSMSGVFALISSAFSNILRAERQAGRAMNGQIIGNLLNMCLDALLIMVVHLDIIGCALAIGVPAALGSILMSVSQILMNAQMDRNPAPLKGAGPIISLRTDSGLR